MKTVNLENIKKIDGKPCKIIYNGAGAFEIDVDDMDGRQNLNYIINKICETDTETFVIHTGDKIISDGKTGEIVKYSDFAYGIDYEDGKSGDFEFLPKSFKIAQAQNRVSFLRRNFGSFE